jgi:hypothetical protein
VKRLSSDYLPDDAECPNCAHAMREHVIELGCEVGWQHPDGDECTCPLTLAEQFSPRHEGDSR